ncbi:hypothetical protein IVB38_13865 [Bradyrhizobium sp. 38]|uniref:hypothetical protein n=1 Tax=unclassified Bradyrhizobium TaxID=2631580 RepID=UPI001FF9E11F|nr:MULTISPECIES: hypothetical protein [unclassified Bradyrhizobium]MCK1337082.1 hypothetical protein [Bradyrhizobium sp. 38]
MTVESMFSMNSAVATIKGITRCLFNSLARSLRPLGMYKWHGMVGFCTQFRGISGERICLSKTAQVELVGGGTSIGLSTCGLPPDEGDREFLSRFVVRWVYAHSKVSFDYYVVRDGGVSDVHLLNRAGARPGDDRLLHRCLRGERHIFDKNGTV